MKLPPVVWSWSGGYIGGHIGGGYGRTSFSNPYGPSIYGGVVDTPVFLVGGQIGYNWQKNGWVFGVELDASRAVSDGTNTCLAALGFVVSANCTAVQTSLQPGPAASVTRSALSAIRWPMSSEAWLGNTIGPTRSITTNIMACSHRRTLISTMVRSVASSGWASSKRLRLHGRSK